MFADGAIVSDIITVDCALSDGTESSCHEFTIPGFPADNEIGPFCPSTVEASTEEGGIWVDGENFFEVDGAVFAELAEIYGDEEWNRIYNEDGTINSIDDAESFTAAARPSIGEEFWYNCIDGKIEWLDGGEPFEITVQIPVVPTQAEK